MNRQFIPKILYNLHINHYRRGNNNNNKACIQQQKIRIFNSKACYPNLPESANLEIPTCYSSRKHIIKRQFCIINPDHHNATIISNEEGFDDTKQIGDGSIAINFSKFDLYRASHIRTNPEKIYELYELPNSKFVPWCEGQFLFVNGNSEKQSLLRPYILEPVYKYSEFFDLKIGCIFLGFDLVNRDPIFSACIKKDIKNDISQNHDGQWLNLKSNIHLVDGYFNEMLVTAHGLMIWHSNNLYSGKTGMLTEPISGGHARTTNTKISRENIVFPRIDPAVIVLVSNGPYCLLGRKSGWEEKKYSLLAGFTEIGETLEMAVYREVLEESNVKVDIESIVYKGSQPWPFPQSLMVGFSAIAARSTFDKDLKRCIPFKLSANINMDLSKTGSSRLSGPAASAAYETGLREEELDEYLGIQLPETVPQENEMDDVKWFHRDFLYSMTNRTLQNSKEPILSLPRSHSISGQLFNQWMGSDREKRVSWKGDSIPDFAIDEGTFKYILIRISDKSGRSKLLVRGNKSKEYHRNIFDATAKECRGTDLYLECLGGGRLIHDTEKKSIYIYGYSSEFGAAVHEITAMICFKWLPLYSTDSIKISYDGY